jgi:uncharacterized protein (DUF2141 family)
MVEKANSRQGCRIEEIRMRPRAKAYVVGVISIIASSVAWAQSPCPGIHVTVLNIRNSTGTVDCALFDSPEGFPVDVLRSAFHVTIMKIRNTQARCDFEDIPAGTYALAVIHDENSNGKLDLNLLGIPTEGYGFSNDAKAVVSAPSFSAASFRYDGRTLDLTISLQY